MGLFGGIVDAIFGGDDTEVTTTTTQQSEVNVSVNPEIGISNVVDLSPVERAMAELARVVDRGQQASAAATVAAAQATGAGLKALADADAARQAQLGQFVADAKAGLVAFGKQVDARVTDAGQAFLLVAGVGLFIYWKRGRA